MLHAVCLCLFVSPLCNLEHSMDLSTELASSRTRISRLKPESPLQPEQRDLSRHPYCCGIGMYEFARDHQRLFEAVMCHMMWGTESVSTSKLGVETRQPMTACILQPPRGGMLSPCDGRVVCVYLVHSYHVPMHSCSHALVLCGWYAEVHIFNVLRKVWYR